MANWRSDRETVHFIAPNMGRFRHFRTIKIRRLFRAGST